MCAILVTLYYISVQYKRLAEKVLKLQPSALERNSKKYLYGHTTETLVLNL